MGQGILSKLRQIVGGWFGSRGLGMAWLPRTGETAAGIPVDENTALNLGTVFACVRVLSETIGSLPLRVYRRLPDGKEADDTHPLYSILHDTPNPLMTAMTWRSLMVSEMLRWGFACAQIIRNGRGQVLELWPVPARFVVPRWDLESSSLCWDIVTPTGIRTLERPDLLVIPAFGGDGITGDSVIRRAREAIGLGLACEESGNRLFGNGARPGGFLKHPGSLSKDAKDRLRDDLERLHRGVKNASRIAVLEEGLDWVQNSIPPDDAQFLQTRLHQVQEIARWFGVPPHLVGDLSHATYANVEQNGINFATHSIRPWCVRIEQGFAHQLMTPTERASYFVEHSLDGLSRGDQASRYASHSIGRQNGWLSIDDVRRIENMNPLPEGRGSDYTIQLNMQAIPAGGLAQVEPPAPAPAAPTPMPPDAMAPPMDPQIDPAKAAK